MLNDLTNEIAQLKEILPDLNSKLEDIETSLKAETFEKVSEHLTKEKVKIFPFWNIGEIIIMILKNKSVRLSTKI